MESNKLSSEELQILTEKIRKFVMMAVSRKRYEHSVRTAEMCRKLCGLFGLDEELGYLAGISHDMCKNLTPELMISISARDGNPVSDLERERPGLLHGRAAAVKLQEDFDFHDKEVIEAVAWHTFGKVGMGDLAKVLYVADKIEPGREHITEEYLNKMYKLSLNDMIKTVLKENIDYLEGKGRAVAPESLALYNSL